MLSMISLFCLPILAVAADCGDLPNEPPVPAVKVDAEDVDVKNDYDTVVSESVGTGIVYLALMNGDSPNPNACGLNAINDPAEWAGWGGPLEAENVTIGEGAGTRNEIVIGGVYFERGIGTHAVATFVYDLTGGDYAKFEGYVGMSDEKDPADCNHGGSSDFTFLVDGTEAYKSAVLMGTDGGVNVPPEKVEFDIPAGAQELTILVGDGDGANSCDHSCIGDPKLMAATASAVDSRDKLTTSWAKMKAE
jgi:hypothetical protein